MKIKTLFFKLTGGRPMKKLSYAFLDVVSKRDVYYFEDRFGRTWLAESPWSIFRVEILNHKPFKTTGFNGGKYNYPT